MNRFNLSQVKEMGRLAAKSFTVTRARAWLRAAMLLMYGVSPVLHTRCYNVLAAFSGVHELNWLTPANPEECPFAPQ
ncbi:MAG: hypothetical protein ABSD58_13075 [Verrucomicrobiia bacterium]